MAEMWDYILYLMNAPFGRTRVPSPTNLKMCDRTKPNVHLSRVPSTSYASAPERCVHRVKYVIRLAPRSWGASTPKQMCIQADLDDADALRHMNENNSERPVCITHPLTPVSTSFLFVFDTEWVMPGRGPRIRRPEIQNVRLS